MAIGVRKDTKKHAPHMVSRVSKKPMTLRTNAWVVQSSRPTGEHKQFRSSTVVPRAQPVDRFGEGVVQLTKCVYVSLERQPPGFRAAVAKVYQKRGEGLSMGRARRQLRRSILATLRKVLDPACVSKISEREVLLCTENYGFTKTRVNQCYTAEIHRMPRVFVALDVGRLLVIVYKHTYPEMLCIADENYVHGYHALDYDKESLRNTTSRNDSSLIGVERLRVTKLLVSTPFSPNWVVEKTSEEFVHKYDRSIAAML